MKNLYTIFATIGFLFTPIDAWAADDHVLGFRLGGTLQQAELHAQAKGWKIRPYPGDTRQRFWVIEGAEATLDVCKNSVLGITRYYEGGLDEFVVLVEHVQHRILNGSPMTNIQQLRTDRDHISLVDAEFKAKDGSRTIVRLSSTNGEVEVSSISWLPDACSDHSR